MGQNFEHHHEATVHATPDQVWDAIATGPGISTWFIGRTDIQGDTIHTTFGDAAMPTGAITTRNPPHHLAHRSDTAPDGRFVAYEYLIEGNDHAATTLRAVTSGFLPGDDWADEYEAMHHGTDLFFATLTEALNHFPGRTATPLVAFGPPVTDWPATWSALHEALGLPPAPTAGDQAKDGSQVYHVNPHALALRTPDALHRYQRGFHGALIAAHSLYTGDADPRRWTTFLAGLQP
ncbi:MAG: SRPBCC domain-containing protein [Actinoplanes sp.]